MRHRLAGFCLTLLLICCYGCSMPVPAGAQQAAPKQTTSEGKQQPLSKFDALRRFGQVLDIVERSYVNDIGQAELVDGAIKGMLQGLDPHSSFMSADEYKEMQETTSGEFFGIGVEIAMENGQVTVVAPIEDTPAFNAGMKTGDIILTINGQSTQEMTLQDVVSRIRGPKGTKVELSILHTNGREPVSLSIVRGAIPIVSVKSKKLEDGYYWIRVTRFSEKTTDELIEAVTKARKEAGKTGIKGIVLDLRNNPGGLLNQAVSVSDLFLRQGAIVSIKGRSNVTERVYTAQAQSTDVEAPLVVLINAGSASASEIVAGALKDQHRAVIVGERSFGKGSVQNIIPLADGSGLKLTVALYYTPDNRSIQAEGVAPDIEIPFEMPSDKDNENRFMLREADLNRHLENGNAADTEQDTEKKSEDKQTREQLAKDNQLRLALQIVKGLPSMQAIKNR